MKPKNKPVTLPVNCSVCGKSLVYSEGHDVSDCRHTIRFDLNGNATLPQNMAAPAQETESPIQRQEEIRQVEEEIHLQEQLDRFVCSAHDFIKKRTDNRLQQVLAAWNHRPVDDALIEALTAISCTDGTEEQKRIARAALKLAKEGR